MNVLERGIVADRNDSEMEEGAPQVEDAARVPEATPDDDKPQPFNGFGVADWLVEPLFDAAVSGLETMARTEVPPRLVPLAGRRHPKLSRAHREEIMSSLGRHEKFTQAVFDRLYEVNDVEAAQLEGLPVEEILALVEQGEAEAVLAVSLLFAAERPEHARVVADWATQQDEASGTLAGIVDALSRENVEAQDRLRRLDQELGHERRARRNLERRIEKASAAADAARAQAARAESQAGWSRVERNAEASRAEELGQQLADFQAAVESGRRERRDLLAELRDLQERYRRARQELREVRAMLPVETAQPLVELRSPKSAPTTADLRDRYLEAGARGVLESKRILLLVDGWNVGLGQIGAERLEDKRRVLEQALERYKGRTANKVMVVYDGRKVSWFWMPRAGGRTIARVFTEGETADDFIVGELEAEAGGEEAPVVATSDRDLRRRCIAAGAFVVSSEDLASILRL